VSWQLLLPLLHSPSILYVLYERLLLDSALIILGENPDQVAGLVLALLDLIRPIPFSGTTRPYLTMQSTTTGGDAALFDPSSPQSQAILLGITNPFLVQRMANPRRYSPLILTLKSTTTETSVPPIHRMFRHAPLRLRRHAAFAPPPASPPPHLRSSIIKPDRAFLHAASTHAGSEATTDVSGIVRRHFADMTARLLAPVNRYLAMAAPGSADRDSKEEGHDQPGAFDVPGFLASLKRDDVAVPFVGRTRAQRSKHRDAFYTALLAGRSFRRWLEIRTLGGDKGGATI
jgi:hypothetical protein